MFTNKNKPKFGTIIISNKEIDVQVKQWWGKGDKHYEALEVRTYNIDNEEQEKNILEILIVMGGYDIIN